MKKRFPEGWDENKVKTVLLHYEKQTEGQSPAPKGCGHVPRGIWATG